MGSLKNGWYRILLNAFTPYGHVDTLSYIILRLYTYIDMYLNTSLISCDK